MTPWVMNPAVVTACCVARQFAKLAAIGKHRDVAVEVLRRLGAEATEILMELLVESDSMPERRGLFTAITRMAEGTDIIVHHLDHPAWYVVRNAAELCGELQLVQSVPSLGRAVGHPDERVRKSVVTALVKIGAREGLEVLARALKDPSPAIRVQVLGSLDGHWGRPLAMSLAALLETEDHPEVVRETLRALGRIGTPDALQALRRAAAGENPRLARRQRLQAIEALGLSGPPAAGQRRVERLDTAGIHRAHALDDREEAVELLAHRFGFGRGKLEPGQVGDPAHNLSA